MGLLGMIEVSCRALEGAKCPRRSIGSVRMPAMLRSINNRKSALCQRFKVGNFNYDYLLILAVRKALRSGCYRISSRNSNAFGPVDFVRGIELYSYAATRIGLLLDIRVGVGQLLSIELSPEALSRMRVIHVTTGVLLGIDLDFNPDVLNVHSVTGDFEG